MGTYKINLDGKEISCNENEDLLRAASRQGGGIFVGCKGGGCGFCKVKVTSGETKDGFYSKKKLTDEEFAEGYRLACKSYPVSDLDVTALKKTNAISR